MAWIDDFLASNLHTEIITALQKGFKKFEVQSATITLAAKTSPPTSEQDVVNGVAEICAATGWSAEIKWGIQTIIFTNGE